MSERGYMAHYTKAGSYVNIHVYATDIEEAVIKADQKFHDKYRKDAEAGFLFDYIEEFGEDAPET